MGKSEWFCLFKCLSCCHEEHIFMSLSRHTYRLSTYWQCHSMKSGQSFRYTQLSNVKHYKRKRLKSHIKSHLIIPSSWPPAASSPGPCRPTWPRSCPRSPGCRRWSGSLTNILVCWRSSLCSCSDPTPPHHQHHCAGPGELSNVSCRLAPPWPELADWPWLTWRYLGDTRWISSPFILGFSYGCKNSLLSPCV